MYRIGAVQARADLPARGRIVILEMPGSAELMEHMRTIIRDRARGRTFTSVSRTLCT